MGDEVDLDVVVGLVDLLHRGVETAEQLAALGLEVGDDLDVAEERVEQVLELELEGGHLAEEEEQAVEDGDTLDDLVDDLLDHLVEGGGEPPGCRSARRRMRPVRVDAHFLDSSSL